MDAAQTVVVLVIILLTVVLVVLGVQVFFILKEFRKTISKTNEILEDAKELTENVSRPLSSFSTLSTGLKVGSLIARLLRGKNKRKDDYDDGE